MNNCWQLNITLTDCHTKDELEESVDIDKPNSETNPARLITNIRVG